MARRWIWRVFGVCIWMVVLGIVPAQYVGAAEESEGQREGLRRSATKFIMAYPAAGLRLVDKDDGLYLATRGIDFLFSPWEGCPPPKHFDDPDDPPLCNMLSHRYPVGEGYRHPIPGFEPGRIRNIAFFKAIYGNNASDVSAKLRVVDFLGEMVSFTSKNGAIHALQRVEDDLEELIKKKPETRKYILPLGGTYVWRNINNSPRLSPHSFGIAIDLSAKKGLYWQWKPSAEALNALRRDYPQSIVDIFERHGFIWGGKWYSFDFMHFEYRPELFIP